jgi:hypothetical protein
MNATMRFIVWGTIPLGSIGGGVLGSLIGLHPTIWVGALGSLVTFLPVTLTSVRLIREMPEPLIEEHAAATLPEVAAAAEVAAAEATGQAEA